MRVEGELSDAFTTNRGLRQGDGLACLFYNLTLEDAIRQSQIQVSGTIFNRMAQLLGHDYDIEIVGKTFVAMSFQA